MNIEFLKTIYLGNTIKAYLIAAIFFLVGIIIIKIVQIIVIRRLKEWSKQTKTNIDDFIIVIIQKLGVPLVYLSILYFAVNSLSLNPFVEKAVNFVWIAALTIAVTRLLLRLLGFGVDIYVEKAGHDDNLRRSLVGILSFSKIIIWGVASIFFLDNLGFKVSTFVAGLGIGGLAVAFAAQAVLKDLLCYFSIIFDRPFMIGDFIIVGDMMGVVAHIGIMSTRITSLGGEQLIFSNADLVSTRVRNYKKMAKRRVVFKLGVTYQTPIEKLKETPEIIKKIVDSVENAAFDRAHFFSYGDFALIIEVVFYVLSGDYNKYMDIQQEINFQIMADFKKRKIEFAYPTQTLYLEKDAQNII